MGSVDIIDAALDVQLFRRRRYRDAVQAEATEAQEFRLSCERPLGVLAFDHHQALTS